MFTRWHAMQLERTSPDTFDGVGLNQVLQAVLLAQFEGGRQTRAWRPELDLPDYIVERALEGWRVLRKVSSTHSGAFHISVLLRVFPLCSTLRKAWELSGWHLSYLCLQQVKLTAFQIEVSDALDALGVQHRLEHGAVNDLFSLDIGIVEGGKQIAVECDGYVSCSVASWMTHLQSETSSTSCQVGGCRPFHYPINSRAALGHTHARRRMLHAGGWSVFPIPW